MRYLDLRAGAATALAALLATTIGAGQGAQQSQQDPPPQQRQPVFRGGSAFVLVDVYPQQEGRVVEGLTAKDFQVFEDGKPQTIEQFEFVRMSPTRNDAERRDPNTQRDALQQAADPFNRVFVILLDRSHVTVWGSNIIRKPLIDMLDRLIGATDLFGVMTTDTQMRHLVFGRKTTSVGEQLTKHSPWGERHRVTVNPDDLEEVWLRDCFGGGSLGREMLDRHREDKTLNSLEALTGFLGAIREARTVVITITDGWRLYRPDPGLLAIAARGELPSIVKRGGTLGIVGGGANPDGPAGKSSCSTEGTRLAYLDHVRRMTEIIALANRSNVSFYPVTPAGLAVFDTPMGRAPSIRDPKDPTEALVANSDRVTERVDTLKTIAHNTDGIAIVDTNDIDGGLKRIVNDVSAYYLLGYYSTNTRLDGRFRRIEVKTIRRDVTIKARRGYVAPVPPAESRPSSAPPARTAPSLPDEVFASLERSRPEFPVFTRVVAVPDALQVSVELARGRVGSAPRPVRVSVSSQGGTRVDATSAIEPPARATAVRIPVVGDAGPWKVVVTVEGGAETLRDELVVAPATTKLVMDSQLFRATSSPRSPLWPAADLQFTRTERIHAEWRLRAPLDRRSARVLGRDGNPLAVPVTLTERDQEGAPTIAVDVGLAPLSAGDYVIELVVGAGDLSETHYLSFRITG